MKLAYKRTKNLETTQTQIESHSNLKSVHCARNVHSECSLDQNQMFEYQPSKTTHAKVFPRKINCLT